MGEKLVPKEKNHILKNKHHSVLRSWSITCWASHETANLEFARICHYQVNSIKKNSASKENSDFQLGNERIVKVNRIPVKAKQN